MISQSRVNWHFGYANPPQLELVLPSLPQHIYKKLPIGTGVKGGVKYDRFLYYSKHQETGLVNVFTGSPEVNEGGYNGRSVPIRLVDGAEEVLLGPFDTAWQPHFPVEPYYPVKIKQERGSIASYISEKALKQIVENLPHVELVESGSEFEPLVIKRKGVEIDHPNREYHGMVYYQTYVYRQSWIEVFHLPEQDNLQNWWWRTCSTSPIQVCHSISDERPTSADGAVAQAKRKIDQALAQEV